MSTVATFEIEDARRGPRVLFELMSGQHGVASRAQARLSGVSRAVEHRLIAEGALVKPLPGVLAAGGVPPTFATQAMAASLRAGVIGVSHGAAARLHCLKGFDDHPLIDVIGRRGAHLRVDPPFISHYSRGPVEQHIVRVAAIPVTSIALTLALVAPTISRVRLHEALSDALSRDVPSASIRAVAEQWRETGRAGPGILLMMLDRISARSTWAADPTAVSFRR